MFRGITISRTNVTLIALVVLLFVQLTWLAHSLTRQGMRFRNIAPAFPRGTYFDMSGGEWIWVTFGPGWPNGDEQSKVNGPRYRFAGIQFFDGGSFAKFIIVPAFWTIPLNLLPILWMLGRRYLAWRALTQRWRRGWCPNCGYDLRATFEICPECGQAVPSKVRRRHYEIEAMSTPPPT